MSEIVLGIISIILVIYNYVVLRSNQKLKTKLQEKDDEASQEKLRVIQEERDRARDRMRHLLEHYHGSKPSGDA